MTTTKAGQANHQAAVDRIWSDVQRKQEASWPVCTCELRAGMDWDDLLKLEEGCTHRLHRYICPVLDFYRRAVGGPPKRDQDLEVAV